MKWSIESCDTQAQEAVLEHAQGTTGARGEVRPRLSVREGFQKEASPKSSLQKCLTFSPGEVA